MPTGLAQTMVPPALPRAGLPLAPDAPEVHPVISAARASTAGCRGDEPTINVGRFDRGPHVTSHRPAACSGLRMT